MESRIIALDKCSEEVEWLRHFLRIFQNGTNLCDQYDALLLVVHITIDDWVLDSSVSFHTNSHKEIMTNYVTNDFSKVYLVDGQSLHVVGIGDVSIKQPTILFGYYRKSSIFCG